MLSKEEIKRISHSDPETIEAVLTMLVARIEQLEARVAELEARNKELERRLGQNSQNSNWPPSRDLKRKSVNHRKSGGKKGGPSGHKGTTLTCSDHPDEIITHTVTSCPACAASLESVQSSGYERRQVFDIPRPVMHVTEHRAERKWCPCCRKLRKAAFPEAITARAQYGPRFLAIASYLHTYQVMPLARMTDLLHVLTGCKPSEATLLSSIERMADTLVPYEAEIRRHLLGSPVIHADETGVHVDKQEHWVHVASTDEWTHFHVHPSRGTEGMKDGDILGGYTGTVCHDFYGPYFKKNTFAFRHTLCGAHLSRECKGITENDGYPWTRDMTDMLHESWKATLEARKNERPLTTDTIAWWERRYDDILDQGKTQLQEKAVPGKKGKRGRQAKSKAENLWARFHDHKSAILGYLRDATIPFDNNQAERDLRMIAVKRKISGCFRSSSMPHNFARLRSFISTLTKQQLPILASLLSAYRGDFTFHSVCAE